jgi:hypothetical protein
MSELDFELLDEEERPSFDPLSPGWYKMVVNSAEDETSKAGNRYLKVEFEVTNVENSGRRVWDNYNLWHPEESVKGIAQRQFSDLARACGLANCKDTDELLGKHLDVLLKVEAGNGEYPPKNRPVAYRSVPSTVAKPSEEKPDKDVPQPGDVPW